MNASAYPEASPEPLPLGVLGVIPARLASTRLPRKVLREIAGKPLLAWVYETAAAYGGFDQVVIAIDSEEVAELCDRNGWPWQMTDPRLPSGTDRLHAVSLEIAAKIYVNVQGDEPLLTPAHFDALLAPFATTAADVTTLKVPCPPQDVADPNIVKVVTGHDGRALYFSRAPIPFDRDAMGPFDRDAMGPFDRDAMGPFDRDAMGPFDRDAMSPFDRDATGNVRYWKHLGLYAYRHTALQQFAALSPGPLEQTERLEQLRLLENGLMLHVAEAPEDALGVNTEEELRKVQAVLRSRQGNT